MTPDEIVEAVVRAMWNAWQRSDNSWDTILECRETNIAARSFYDAGMSEARAAISVLTPIIQRETAEKCAEILNEKTEAELEVAAAMNGDFDSRRLALALRMVGGKIISQKQAAIRAAFK